MDIKCRTDRQRYGGLKPKTSVITRTLNGSDAPIKRTHLFTTQFPWTNIATFWMPRRTATESMEGPRRLIRLAKGMTFTAEGAQDIRQGKRPRPFPPPATPHPPSLYSFRLTQPPQHGNNADDAGNNKC